MDDDVRIMTGSVMPKVLVKSIYKHFNKFSTIKNIISAEF